MLRPPSVHDALNLLTDSSATWGGSVSPPVALLPDGAGRDRDPSRQAPDRSGSSDPLHRPPSVHDALNLMTDSSWTGGWHTREQRERD